MANGHGGKRTGAGRKPGAKWQSPVRALRVEARAKLAQIVGSAADPLSFVCELAADEEQPVALRLEAAALALPYTHPRLSAAVVATSRIADSDSSATVERIAAKLERIAQGVLAAPTNADASPATIEGAAVKQ